MKEDLIHFKSEEGFEMHIPRKQFLQYLEQFQSDKPNGIDSLSDTPKFYDWVNEEKYNPSKVESWMRFMKGQSEIQDVVSSLRNYLIKHASNAKYAKQFIKNDLETFAESRVVMYACVRWLLSNNFATKGDSGSLIHSKLEDLLAKSVNLEDFEEKVGFLSSILPQVAGDTHGKVNVHELLGGENVKTIIKRVTLPSDITSIDTKFKDTFLMETLYVVYKCEEDLSDWSACYLTGLIASWLGVLKQEEDYDGENPYSHFLKKEVENMLSRLKRKKS